MPCHSIFWFCLCTPALWCNVPALLLQVPDRGTVAGVIWYFPAEHEVETLPLANSTLAQRPIVTFNMTQQDPAAAGPGHGTQQPQLTQLAAAPSGRPLLLHLFQDSLLLLKLVPDGMFADAQCSCSSSC